MTAKIDKSKCAMLVVEAALLTESIEHQYKSVLWLGTFGIQARRVYKKSLHRYFRRCAVYNAIIDTSGRRGDKVYVGDCDENTPTYNMYSLPMGNDDTIYIDISKHKICQP